MVRAVLLLRCSSLAYNRLFLPCSQTQSIHRSFRYIWSSPTPDIIGSPDDDDVAKKLGFHKVSDQIIDDWKLNAVLYKHKRTGAEVASLSNDDENKFFSIVFRTPPKDSTGIPHILEHSVFCGSRKYPLNASGNAFSNVSTHPYRTCYQVASANSKCVVDDARTFQQEGWHYELNDPSEEIYFKGVVFNEMKEVYSQPENILRRTTQQALFPDNAYGFDSCGDPRDIPKLTYKEFKDFHRKYYHPSNARIWFYGDDDTNERLLILSEYLDLFDASPVSSESKIQPQALFSKPVRIIEKYPTSESAELKKKHMVCLNWLLSDKPVDMETEIALALLDYLMLGTPASPLSRILLESGFGEAVGGRIDDELIQFQFSIGLKGVSEEDIQKVEELIMSTLKSLAEEGFDPKAVETSMVTIEHLFEVVNTGLVPRGEALLHMSIEKWINDMDPFEPLKYEKPLASLKARIAEQGSKAVLSPLIEKLILNNPHRVTVEMQVRLLKKKKKKKKKLMSCFICRWLSLLGSIILVFGFVQRIH